MRKDEFNEIFYNVRQEIEGEILGVVSEKVQDDFYTIIANINGTTFKGAGKKFFKEAISKSHDVSIKSSDDNIEINLRFIAEKTFQYNKLKIVDMEFDTFPGTIYENCVILSGEGVEPQYEIDLACDFEFNTGVKIKQVKEEIPVSNLEEMCKISKKRNSEIDFIYKKKTEGLYCGMGEDFLIDNNLCGKWI